MKAIKRFDVTLYTVCLYIVHTIDVRSADTLVKDKRNRLKRPKGQEEERGKSCRLSSHTIYATLCILQFQQMVSFASYGIRTWEAERNSLQMKTKRGTLFSVGVISCEVHRHWSVNRDGVDYSSMGFAVLSLNVCVAQVHASIQPRSLLTHDELIFSVFITWKCRCMGKLQMLSNGKINSSDANNFFPCFFFLAVPTLFSFPFTSFTRAHTRRISISDFRVENWKYKCIVIVYCSEYPADST